MVPFVEIPPVVIGKWHIDAFTILVVTAVLAGHFGLLARSRRLGVDVRTAAGMSLWACLGGFTGSHLLKLVYSPAILLQGWSGVLDIFNGMSSFGGLGGALLAIPVYFRVFRIDAGLRSALLDCLGYVFPFAWTLGRLGCALTHDHPGMPTANPLGVAFPGGPRYDLGLLEVIFLVAGILPLFLWLDRKPRSPGTYAGLFLSAYGVFRILLDGLHEEPQRLFGITIDQFGGACAAFAGLWILRGALRAAPNRSREQPA